MIYRKMGHDIFESNLWVNVDRDRFPKQMNLHYSTLHLSQIELIERIRIYLEFK